MHSYPDTYKKTILIVDDQPTNLDILAYLLNNKGYKVRRAIDGQTALKMVCSQPVDLILLDIIMPAMNGYEVCRRLKNNDATRKIPVIFITALNEDKKKLKGFNVGAVDYITKPFCPEEVFARVCVHLTILELRRQQRNENERFRNLSEAAFEALMIHINGPIVEVNRNMAKLAGYDREKLIGRDAYSLLSSDLRSKAMYCFNEADELLSSDCANKGEILTQSGERVTIEMQARKIIWQDRRAQVIALRDITWRKTLEHKTFELESENLKLKATFGERGHLGGFIGQSLVMQNVYKRLLSIAASDETVIIYGESGTGKELAVQTIFNLSRRFTKKLIPVNCGAIPETLFESQFFGYCKGAFTGAERNTPGYFEKARGGILFLDEIAELSLPCQIKLLRVLNDKTYTPVGASTPLRADVRIIAATKQKLRELVQAGQIRADFFYRIHVITMEMPPLRDHKEDIPLLINHFINQHTPPDKDPPAIPSVIHDIFRNHNWPGNVRELFNELHRFLSNGEIELSDAVARHKAPKHKNRVALKSGSSFNTSVAAYEKQLISQALKETRGNKKAAAELLQMPLATMHRKTKCFGLNCRERHL